MPNTLLIIAVLFVVLAILATVLFEARVRAGRPVERRPLRPLEQVDLALARAAETGRPIHITPGAGPLEGPAVAAETFAGLVLAQRLGEAAARRGAGVAASSGDAVAHLALQGQLRRAYREAGYAENHEPSSIRLYTHNDSLAFAAGLGSRYKEQPFEASVAVGAFGPHYLLVGAQGAQHQLPQIAGTTTPESLAAMVLTSGATLMGEEIYAAEAYLRPTPGGLSRLLTHDLLRALLIGLLLVGLIFEALRAAGMVDLQLPL